MSSGIPGVPTLNYELSIGSVLSNTVLGMEGISSFVCSPHITDLQGAFSTSNECNSITATAGLQVQFNSIQEAVKSVS